MKLNYLVIIIFFSLLAPYSLWAADAGNYCMPAPDPIDVLIKDGFEQEASLDNKGIIITPWVKYIRCLGGELRVRARFLNEAEKEVGDVLGIIMPTPQKAHLKGISSTIPRQNFGSTILRWFLKKCADYHVKKVVLSVFPFGASKLTFEQTQNFYKKHGGFEFQEGDNNMAFALKPSADLQPDEIVWRAARAGSLEQVIPVLQNHARTDTRKAACAIAAKSRHWHVVEYLRKEDCSIDDQVNILNEKVLCAIEQPLILWAVERRDEPLVHDLLVEGKACPNVTDEDRITPLHKAARLGCPNLVDLLLKHKAEVNARTERGNSALHEACAVPDPDILRALIAHKADVNAPNEKYETPLHAAAIKGDAPTIQLLLDSKADPMQPSKFDGIPSAWASGPVKELLLAAQTAKRRL